MSNRGFTIVELIVSITILAILALFIIVISEQMLLITAKTQSRNVALSLAQAKIEELRSSLLIPESFQDEPKSGYIRTVTSTYVPELEQTGTSSVIQFLRDVTVSVRTPTAFGSHTVTLQTFIQTYRPQVLFFFPQTAESCVLNSPTVLEGTIRDDGYEIPLNQIHLRTRIGTTGIWSTWTPLTSIYTDMERQIPVTGGNLLIGTTYYFTVETSGAPGDGNIQEIQVQATNTASKTNEMPLLPRGLSPYIRLITDNSPPNISVTISPTTTLTPSVQLLVTVTASDPVVGGVASDIRDLYVVLKKVTPGGEVFYWRDDGEEPFWQSGTATFYCLMSFDVSAQIYVYPGPTVTSVWPRLPFASDPIGTQCLVQVFAIDRVIGKYYDFRSLIPSEGDFPWPDVNANGRASSPVTITMKPPPSIATLAADQVTGTTARLNSLVNPNDVPSTVWFEYGLTTSYGSTTPPFILTDTSTTSFSQSIGFPPFGPLIPDTEYHFRAVVQNPWGTYYSEDLVFQTLSE